jgi:hypothetical protein
MCAPHRRCVRSLRQGSCRRGRRARGTRRAHMDPAQSLSGLEQEGACHSCLPGQRRSSPRGRVRVDGDRHTWRIRSTAPDDRSDPLHVECRARVAVVESPALRRPHVRRVLEPLPRLLALGVVRIEPVVLPLTRLLGGGGPRPLTVREPVQPLPRRASARRRPRSAAGCSSFSSD